MMKTFKFLGESSWKSTTTHIELKGLRGNAITSGHGGKETQDLFDHAVQVLEAKDAVQA